MNHTRTIFLSIFFIASSLILVQDADARQKLTIGEVVEVTGASYSSATQNSLVKQGTKIALTDTLTTQAGGFIEFLFQTHSRIYLKPNSRVVFHHSEHLEGSTVRIKLLSGEMMVETTESPQPVQVTTPTATASATHARYSIAIERNGSTTFTGIDGTAEVTAATSGETQMLARRNKLSTDMRGQYFTVQHISNREVNGVLHMYNRSSNRIPELNNN